MRIEGWEARLVEYIDEARNKEFQWGNHDCALWCARWVELITGKNHWNDWQGKYSTELGAARLMKKRGFQTAEAIVDHHLHVRPVLLARRGDLVLSSQQTIGICAGIQSYFLTEDGILNSATGDCVKAWTVD